MKLDISDAKNEAKKFKKNDFTGKNKEKSKIAIAMLEKFTI